MTLHHHPDEALLIDFASGSLAGGARMVVASHVGACLACERQVLEAESVGGALLSALPPAALEPDALQRALARIERPEPAAKIAPPSPPGWIDVPPEVLKAAKRRRHAAPGVWVASVTKGPGRARSYLLGVAAGMSVPRHTHKGVEFVVVLKGAYRDGDALHGPGDFASSDDAVDHRPRVTADGECVCLISAENALVARDWVGRLFQPFVGI